MYCVRGKQNILYANIVHGAYLGQKAACKQDPLCDESVAPSPFSVSEQSPFDIALY